MSVKIVYNKIGSSPTPSLFEDTHVNAWRVSLPKAWHHPGYRENAIYSIKPVPEGDGDVKIVS